LAERYERRSVLVSSNLVFSKWDQIFKDPMTTMAAVDRLVHHAIILEFDGESHRIAKPKEKKAANPAPAHAFAPLSSRMTGYTSPLSQTGLAYHASGSLDVISEPTARAAAPRPVGLGWGGCADTIRWSTKQMFREPVYPIPKVHS